jgi:biopolymer transport protein ExbD
MAELDTSGGGHKKGPGVKKAKKQSTRVDLTPMVDLGFLLITFFIFTTTMSQPTALNLTLPKDTDNPEERNKAKESGALTILLGKDNHIFYYKGQLKEDASNFLSASFNGENSIRDIIIGMRKDVIGSHTHTTSCTEIQNTAKEKKNPNWQIACLDRDFVVVIKPGPESNYKNVIDILDEMAINFAKRYALVDISDIEVQLIQKSEAAGGK